MIDTHIHFYAAQYAEAERAIKRARARGIEAIVVPGVDAQSNLKALELARCFPGFVYPAVGIHPELGDLSERAVKDTAAQIRTARGTICAIGEVGLPWYGTSAKSPGRAARAKVVLSHMAALASDLDLALIIHAPHDTAATALRLITEAGVSRAVFHWHKADWPTTEAIIEAGYFISLTPEIAYRERGREMAARIPMERLVVETDGPYPYKGPLSGRPTEPAMVGMAIAAIADVQSRSVKAVREATVRNAKALFRIGWT